MNISLSTNIIPLKLWDDGSIRVGGTRVLLDLIVRAFHEGRSPEEIVVSYPTLVLPDVYATITYYLQNQVELDAYLAQRETEAAELWEKIQNDSQQQLRHRLLSRKTKYTQTL